MLGLDEKVYICGFCNKYPGHFFFTNGYESYVDHMKKDHPEEWENWEKNCNAN